MKLWTAQPKSYLDVYMKWLELGKKVDLSIVCDPLSQETFAYGSSNAVAAYNWLAEQMKIRLYSQDKWADLPEWPIWAWYMYDGKHEEPNWKDIGVSEDSVIFELDVPDELVLLSDVDSWIYVINNLYYCAATSEEEYDEREKVYDSLPDKASACKESWLGIFNLSPFDNDFACRGKFIQGTFFELHMSYIKNYKLSKDILGK